MNSLGFIFSLLLAAPAVLACPNLRGTYLCQQNSYHTDILYSFDQSRHMGDWVFTMTVKMPNQKVLASYRFLTDGIERKVVDQVSGNPLLLEASCEKEVLNVSGTANSDQPKPIRFSESLSLTPTGDLSNISLDINGNKIQEFCARQ